MKNRRKNRKVTPRSVPAAPVSVPASAPATLVSASASASAPATPASAPASAPVPPASAPTPHAPSGSVQRPSAHWAHRLGLVGGIIGILGGIAGAVSAWSGVVSARASERSALVAEAALQRQEQDSTLAAATLQATEPVSLGFTILPNGALVVFNHSKMDVAQIEIDELILKYSHVCDVVLFVQGGPEKSIASLPYDGQTSIQLMADYWNPDGGPAALHHAQTWDELTCDDLLGDADGEPSDAGKGSVNPACTEANPCTLITYVEARAMHPKLFQWTGPFDELGVYSPDGNLRSSWLYGKLHQDGDGGYFEFNQESDRKMFLRVAEYLREYKARWGMFNRSQSMDPGRAFGGIGVFRAVGADEPRP